MIYTVDSAIQLLNNRGQQKMCGSRAFSVTCWGWGTFVTHFGLWDVRLGSVPLSVEFIIVWPVKANMPAKINTWICQYYEICYVYTRRDIFSLRSRRLELVCTRKHGPARRRHARGEGEGELPHPSRVSLARTSFLFRPLLPSACYAG